MADLIEQESDDTLEVQDEPKSSARILSAIDKAERAMNPWQALCDEIDDAYSKREVTSETWIDSEYDLFWSSMEVMKPAVYARPPQPVVSPQFKDRRKLQNLTAELLERSVVSAFDRTCLDEGMLAARDDLIFYNRGQLWLTYETHEGQKVVVEHRDRKDFLHPPARKWSEVPWVATRAWMTKAEMRRRFHRSSKDAYKDATPSAAQKREDDGGADHSKKVGVWEVWHKADSRVYWVAPGVSVMLDQGEPHLKLSGFFPCPKPAYGTLRRRTLVPTPDYVRYVGHFTKINSLTKRIYDLLDQVRLKGLIPAGGDVGDAVEQLIAEDRETTLLIPVPAASLIGSTGNFVQWLPVEQVAAAIQGLIEARRELFGDFDRLSGISDIMRGETEAEETLGAQRLKSQYGSVRVRSKSEELQRLARDVTRIAAEIMADKFSKETLLEMSQMEVPTKVEIDKRIKEIEASAKAELKEIGQKAQQSAQGAQTQGQQVDPAQAQQMLQQAQQQVFEKYGPMLQEATDEVPIEDVMRLLRDDRARGFAFEIATDSTVMTDEMQEKASRNEFLEVFTRGSQALMTLVTAGGPAGAKLAGEVFKFVLQPYRVGRDLNSVIDEFIDSAPQMAQAAGGQGNGEAEKALAEANQKIAEAELQKAQAAVAKVQADTQLKGFELQQRQAIAEAQTQRDAERFGLEMEQTKGKLAETDAKIEKIWAEIQKIGVDASNQTRAQDREDVKATADISMRQTDQALSAQDRRRQAFESDRDADFRAADNARSDRQQAYAERSGDRQQSFAERQSKGDGA